MNYKQREWRTSGFLAIALSIVFLVQGVAAEPFAEQRAASLRGARCTYGAAPLRPDGHVNLEQLLAELTDLHANTYRWVYRSGGTNLADLKAFLPLARAKNLRVWINVNPPSEQPKSIPADQLKSDYERTARELANLSLAETNLVAWTIDDFVWNLKFFNPEYTAKLLKLQRELNPRLAFIPCCYYKAVTPAFAKAYGPLMDGIIFPYRDESHGGNFKTADYVEAEVKNLRSKFGPDVPIVVSIFASRHSKLGLPSTEYVEQALGEANRWGDSVSVYKNPHKGSEPEKYEIVRESFTKWAQER